MNYTSRNLRYMLDVSIVSIEKSPCENLERQQYSQPLSSSGQHGKGVFLFKNWRNNSSDDVGYGSGKNDARASGNGGWLLDLAMVWL